MTMIDYLRCLSPGMLTVLRQWAEELPPYQLLMVQSNLAAITNGRSADDALNNLCANGQRRVACAVAVHSL